MPKSPDFRTRSPNISDMLGDMRRPPVLAETGWHYVGATQPEGVAFENNWNNVTGEAPASWYLSEDGEVRLRGKVTGGEVGTIIFTLPEEVRPEFAETWVVAMDPTGWAKIRIEPDGDVICLETSA